MHGGAQIAVRGHFEDFADIDDKGSRHRRSVDPAVFAFDLEAGFFILEKDGQKARNPCGRQRPDRFHPAPAPDSE